MKKPILKTNEELWCLRQIYRVTPGVTKVLVEQLEWRPTRQGQVLLVAKVRNISLPMDDKPNFYTICHNSQVLTSSLPLPIYNGKFFEIDLTNHQFREGNIFMLVVDETEVIPLFVPFRDF